MEKQKIKKFFITIIFFLLNLFLSNKVFAVSLLLDTPVDEVGIKQQFYLDLKLDPEGQSFNAIKGNIIFNNENISFVRAEDGKSMVNLWVEKPKQDGGIINFAGVMSNGFEGVIDPFTPENKLPGLIVRLIFEAKKSGDVVFNTSSFVVNKNDGAGTEVDIEPVYQSVKVGDFVNQYKYENVTGETPKLEAFITRDESIFNNKYIIVFNASDKGTGIKNVLIKEGNRDWREIESPYLLKDQSRHSQIILQATNFSGGSIAIKIDPIPYDIKPLTKSLILVILVLGLTILIIRKFYVNKK